MKKLEMNAIQMNEQELLEVDGGGLWEDVCTGVGGYYGAVTGAAAGAAMAEGAEEGSIIGSFAGPVGTGVGLVAGIGIGYIVSKL